MNTELRLLYAALTALIAGLLSGPVIIPILRRLKVGQTIREDGPATHLKKGGTPTMGGVIFLVPLIISAVLWVPFEQRSLALAWIWLVVGFGTIGFMDDYIKVVKRQSLGLRAREKLVGQILVGTIFFLMLRFLEVPSELVFPVIGYRLDLGWLYLPFVILIAMAAGNGVNLTDGIDGLCGSTVIVAALAYALIGLVTGVEVVSILSAALIGGLLAFLRFNWHPAKVFMGDVGSLALGAALAGAAVLTKTELLLIPIGLVFVLETLSVMIQVIYFKATGGKRVFRMAPVHHHFELVGWSELRIVLVWCFIAIVGGIIGLLGLANMGLR